MNETNISLIAILFDMRLYSYYILISFENDVAKKVVLQLMSNLWFPSG